MKGSLIVRIAEATGVKTIDKAEKESETETFTFWQNERSPPSHGRVFKTTSIKINFRACFWKNFGSCPLRQALQWAQRFWSNTYGLPWSITNRLHLNMQFHSEHIFFFFYSSTIIFECIFVNFVDFLLACRLKTMQKEYEWVEKGLEQNNASHFFALQYHCCGRRIYAK